MCSLINDFISLSDSRTTFLWCILAAQNSSCKCTLQAVCNLIIKIMNIINDNSSHPPPPHFESVPTPLLILLRYVLIIPLSRWRQSWFCAGFYKPFNSPFLLITSYLSWNGPGDNLMTNFVHPSSSMRQFAYTCQEQDSNNSMQILVAFPLI